MIPQEKRSTYISYSTDDGDFALKLARELKASGFSIWMDQLDVPPGSNREAERERALAQCYVFMVILTPAAMSSENVKDEIGHALDHGKHILPIVLDQYLEPKSSEQFKYAWIESEFFDTDVKQVKSLLQKLIEDHTNSGDIFRDRRSYPAPMAAPPRPNLLEWGSTKVREWIATVRGNKEAPEAASDNTVGTEEPVAASQEDVGFTAFYPKEGKVDTWYNLQVYAHTLSAQEKVREDAKRFDPGIEDLRESSSTSSVRIARGTDITVVPSCEGVIFNPEDITFKWLEDYHPARFFFKADKSLSNNPAIGQITIYIGPLIISTIDFSLLFDEKEHRSIIEHKEQAKMYPKGSIFISYSHDDKDIASLFRNYVELTDYDVLIDNDDLRTGEDWNEELMHMIEKANIFQLLWSENSSKSPFCQQEWEHALEQNKGNRFIRPVYWKIPFPSPPEELSKIHFEYRDLMPQKTT